MSPGRRRGTSSLSVLLFVAQAITGTGISFEVAWHEVKLISIAWGAGMYWLGPFEYPSKQALL